VINRLMHLSKKKKRLMQSIMCSLCSQIKKSLFIGYHV
jgi:hypothetical protein